MTNETANAALAPLSFLIGEWTTTGTHPYMPGVELHGRTSFEWIEGGGFLMTRSEIDDPRFPKGVAILASDDATGEYYLLYFDDRGVSRKYDVTFENDVLRWSRETPEFSQRVTLSVTNGGAEMVSKGEMSKDGAPWGPDLSLSYSRVA